MRTNQTAPKTIDEYIAGFPHDVQEILEEIRMTIRKAAPDAEETISYQMPTFTLKGNLVHFAAFKKHIGFYPTPTGIEEFKKELSVYEGGKGSVKFPLDQPIPYDLISRIVTFRVKENLERAKGKSGSYDVPAGRTGNGQDHLAHNKLSFRSFHVTTMKAVRIHTYGGTDVLTYEDASRPTAGEGEVLIRVHATTVNPFDCAVRAGYLAAYFNYTLPLILGTDVSGVIEEVGAGVTNFAPGDEVYARAGVTRNGANAEYVAVVASDVAAKPQSLDHIHAAALPHVVLTAWQALVEAGQLTKGQTVLIHGAAGGVGHVAVQLARLRGARVIGTASVNLDVLRDLVVDEAINYTTTPFETVVRDVDVVLDLVGGETQERSWALLRPGGMLISTVQAPAEATAVAHGVRQHFVVSTPPIGKTLAEVAAMVDGGQIKPVVSTVLPLHDIRQAHALIEGKHVHGKIVLTVV